MTPRFGLRFKSYLGPWINPWIRVWDLGITGYQGRLITPFDIPMGFSTLG